MTRIFRLLPLLLAGCLCIVAAMGCSITTSNQGECGIRYGTEVTFFHRAAQTAPVPATISTDFPSLEDFIKSKTNSPPAPVATESVTVTTVE